TDYGQLSATGAATLGGTLTLSTASGFSPPVGTQYTLLQAASVSGTFATVNGTQLGDRAFVISYTPTSVIATVELVPPSVAGVSPTGGPSAGGNTVTITGTNFTSDSTVRFGLVVASPITLVSSTQLMVSVPTHSAGQVDVTVTTPGGTSATSSADQYAYDSPPAVTRVRPTAGPTKGLNTVTITG